MVRTHKEVQFHFLSKIEPNSFKEEKTNECWVKEMEELNQIEKSQTWELVQRPGDKNVIGTKRVFKTKLNEEGKVTRSKERIIWKGYAQVEGIYFEETFASMARFEATVLFLSYASFKKFKVY